MRAEWEPVICGSRSGAEKHHLDPLSPEVSRKACTHKDHCGNTGSATP